MDLLSQHEAFLRAIFDNPEDDTARLVYADFLQEHGEDHRAEFIRWQCGTGEKPATVPDFPEQYERGFPKPWKTTTLSLPRLDAVDDLRHSLITLSPACFAVQSLAFVDGRIHSGAPFDTLFSLAAFARVTELNLSGAEIEEERLADSPFMPFRLEPVITPRGVEALAQHRGARRLTSLILTNNNLDNDAARALVASPYLANLKRLDLLEGNRFRGKVWQQVLERFGEDVVG
jgi:uncharacterized protein (TIGR02996 family)